MQELAIPAALEDRDVIAVAQTGTGKTLAFGLPCLTLLAEGRSNGGTRMVVLAPTRELAVQVHSVLDSFCAPLGLRSACVYGGVGMLPQTKALRAGVDVVVATPGRLLDHVRQGNTRFRDVEILVLDEADRMLDMGFLPDIRRVMDTLPTSRQTLMFSATFPQEIERLTKVMMHDPLRFDVGVTSKPVDAVRQSVYTVDHAGKTGLLAKILDEVEVESAIVFTRTKSRTDRVADALLKKGFKAQSLHGGHSQSQRQRALDAFRRGRSTILVATDVAARGLDVLGVTHVVNYDVPGSFDDYVHRIGRTARNNASGDAITFVSPQDFQDLGAIERGLGKKIPQTAWEGAVTVLSLY
ncbi:MAG: DEAD/DEAH box helicase, partial [Candidatus Hydrogenedentota bacterium]